MGTALVLVRHGETSWNAEGRLQGQTDIPLNDVGRAQARAAGIELSGRSWDVVVSSTLGRAVETAELIGSTLGVEPVDQLGDLCERHYGKAEGHLVKGLPRPDIDDLLLSAEPEAEVSRRGIAALCELLGRHEGKKIVAVAHGTLIRLTLDAISDGPPMKIMRNGEIAEVDVAALRRHMEMARP